MPAGAFRLSLYGEKAPDLFAPNSIRNTDGCSSLRTFALGFEFSHLIVIQRGLFPILRAAVYDFPIPFF